MGVERRSNSEEISTHFEDKIDVERTNWVSQQFGTSERAKEAFLEVGLPFGPDQIDSVRQVFENNKITRESFVEYINPEKRQNSDPGNPFYVLRELGQAYSSSGMKNLRRRDHIKPEYREYPILSGNGPTMHAPRPTSDETVAAFWEQEKGSFPDPDDEEY
jgi:hypothetical protein